MACHLTPARAWLRLSPRTCPETGVYDQPDAAAVEAQFDRLLDYVHTILPAAADHLEAARADLLAYRRLPCQGMETDLVQQSPKNASTEGSVAALTQ